MKQSTAILFFPFLISFAIVSAQTTPVDSIRGRVVEQGHHALPGATIRLKYDGASDRMTQSDSTGQFYFRTLIAGNYQIEITLVGYAILRELVLVDNLQPPFGLRDYELKDSSHLLDEVTIRKSIEPVAHQLDKTVVNIAQNITTQGATLWEVLRKLPGVQVTPDGQISLNGKPGVNVLIDGKPTYLSAGDLEGLLEGMQASGVQRVELMSNPSSKYDAAGTAGIINIVRKKNTKDGFNGSMNGSVGYAYYGRYNGGVTLNYKNTNINLFASNTYTYGKGFSRNLVASEILAADNHVQSEQVSANKGENAYGNYRPTLNLEIYLSSRSTLTIAATAGLGSSNASVVSDMNLRDSAFNKTGHVSFLSNLHDRPQNFTTGLQFSRQLDTAGKSFTVSADLSQYRNFPFQTNYTTQLNTLTNSITENDYLFMQHRQLDIYAAKVDYSQPLKNKGSFEAGIKTSYVRANNNNTVYDLYSGSRQVDTIQSDYSINSENINAAYININSAWSKISIEAGLRAEQMVTKGKELLTGSDIYLNYLQIFPTLFVSDILSNQNSITIRLGRRTDRPDYHELVPFRRPQTATLFFQGNPDLKPQLSWHGELGWVFRQAFTVTFNYDFYKDYIRTFPFLDSNKTTITRRPVNVQGAHSWELDLNYTIKPVAWWSAATTAAFYRNSFTGQAAGYSLDNAGLVSLQFNMNNSFRISSILSAECDFEYDTKRQYVNSTYGAYALLDIGIKLALFSGQGSIALNGNNVLQSQDRNAIDRNAGLYQVTDLHFYSRSVSLNFTYRFGAGKMKNIKLNSGSADEQKRAGN